MVWMMVLLDAMPCIMPKPATSIIPIDSQNVCERPKPISPAPKTALETEILRPSPSTLRRAASSNAPTNAPVPMAPIRKPKVCGPPCSTRAAKIGISTTKGMPIRLMTAKSDRMVRMGTNCETYVQPSFSSISMDVTARFTVGV